MAAVSLATRGTAFAEDAGKAGWEVSLENENGNKEIVTAKHGSSGIFIVIVWDSGRYNYGESYQSQDGNKKTIRNAAEARRILGNTSGVKVETKRSVRKVAPTRNWDAESQPVRPQPKRLPFKISQPDRDILEAVLGKNITWWNAKARRVESASVMPNEDQKHLAIVNAKGKRILNWAANGGGFRSVYIENILEIR